jgi:hypothetical protein
MWRYVSATGGRRQQRSRLSSGTNYCGAGGAPRAAAFRSIGACCFGWSFWAGRRGGVRAGAEPVVSGGPEGSAVMMLTGGIESDDGKKSSGPVRGEPGGANADAPAGNGDAPGIAPGAMFATGLGADAGQTEAWRVT